MRSTNVFDFFAENFIRSITYFFNEVYKSIYSELHDEEDMTLMFKMQFLKFLNLKIAPRKYMEINRILNRVRTLKT